MSIHGLTITILASAVVGIVIGYRFPFASEIAVALPLLALIQGVLAFVVRGGMRIALYTAIITAVMFLGIVRVQLEEATTPFVCDTPCTVLGTVVASPKYRETYQLLTLSVDDANAFIQAYVPLYPKYSAGDVVSLTGTIKEPEALFPHDTKNRGFDYASYLSNRNIGSQALFPKIHATGTQEHTIMTTLQHIENSMAEQAHLFLQPGASALATGMLLGRDELAKDVAETFRVAGVSHIVVLSGFNIAIIVSFILFVFKFVPLGVRIALACIATSSFVAMVGGEASIIRATLMAGIALLAVALGRGYVAKQALIMSLIAIIFYKPNLLLTDVSLHLSFIATAGIIYLTPIIKDMIQGVLTQGLFNDIIATTVAAYVSTLPYQLYMFGSISVYALLANIIIVPLVPLGMLLSFLSIIVSYVSTPLGEMLGFITTIFLDGMITCIGFIAFIPLASIGLHLSLFGMGACYVGIVTLAFFLSRAKHETRLSEHGVTNDETIYTY